MSSVQQHVSPRESRPRQYWQQQHPGALGQVELAFRFATWALTFRRPPTIDDAVARWGMSRATACRYLQAFRASGMQGGLNA